MHVALGMTYQLLSLIQIPNSPYKEEDRLLCFLS